MYSFLFKLRITSNLLLDRALGVFSSSPLFPYTDICGDGHCLGLNLKFQIKGRFFGLKNKNICIP